MSTELTMIVRYALMAFVGSLVTQGVISASLVEPFVGLGLAIAVYAWKKAEAKGWFK